MDWTEALVPYFEYFEENYLFFSTMLASKDANGHHRLSEPDFFTISWKDLKARSINPTIPSQSSQFVALGE